MKNCKTYVKGKTYNGEEIYGYVDGYVSNDMNDVFAIVIDKNGKFHRVIIDNLKAISDYEYKLKKI